MMMTSVSRFRLWVAGGLALCAVVLVVVSGLTGRAGPRAGRPTTARPVSSEPRTIAQHVDAVASSFKIPRTAMRTRTVKEGTQSLTEVRMMVPPDFSSLEFNCALASVLTDLDAKVVGTEHTHEKSIALQIVKDSVPVMVVILDMRQPPQQQRKESHH
jgi:hypothetical protein